MSNTLTGAGARFLRDFDFNSAIAACDTFLSVNQPRKNPRTRRASANDLIIRAYARCFIETNDNENLDKAISDCSMAISALGHTSVTAHRIRAYAYYLRDDCTNAILNCKYVLNPSHGADGEDMIFIRDLLTIIYCNRGEYIDAIKTIGRFRLNAHIVPLTPNIFPTVTIADSYRESLKKMRINN